nr:hypothetical protein [uncultured Cohaesibacter sp.]
MPGKVERIAKDAMGGSRILKNLFPVKKGNEGRGIPTIAAHLMRLCQAKPSASPEMPWAAAVF